MIEGKTQRGFDITQFKDRYDAQCSLQKSSIATEQCIWLGVTEADPKFLDKNAGWVKYPMPKEVLLNTRMHLTQDMVKNLLPYLQKFADTGETI